MPQKTFPPETSKDENLKDHKPKRKRGAQPGNTNALKHGFYSRHFSKNDLSDLEINATKGVQDEITMLRVFIRYVLQLSTGAQTLPEALACLRAISLSVTALSRLIKVQHVVFGSTSELDEALHLALQDITEELDLHL